VRLQLGDAQWTREDEVIELKSDGSVIEDDDVLFRVDRVGRVYEEDGDPMGILLPTGDLVGENNVSLGEVGAVSAAPPGAAFAWLSLARDGSVIRYSEDGDRVADGQWAGCRGPVLPTCTLVTHVVAYREWKRRPRMSVGVGVMIPIQ
jgi:hypothetical protein